MNTLWKYSWSPVKSSMWRFIVELNLYLSGFYHCTSHLSAVKSSNQIAGKYGKRLWFSPVELEFEDARFAQRVAWFSTITINNLGHCYKRK